MNRRHVFLVIGAVLFAASLLWMYLTPGVPNPLSSQPVMFFGTALLFGLGITCFMACWVLGDGK